MPELERCCVCDDPTGRAGRGEGSLYCETCDAGPFCPDCFEKHLLEEHDAAAKNEAPETTDPTTEALKLWSSPDVLAMLDRQGWPEWREGDGRYRLCLRSSGWRIDQYSSEKEWWIQVAIPSPHAALSLAVLRDDSLKKIREWADAKDVTLNIATCGSVCTITTSDIDDQIRCIAEEDGYDETLVAARQAIEHE